MIRVASGSELETLLLAGNLIVNSESDDPTLSALYTLTQLDVSNNKLVSVPHPIMVRSLPRSVSRCLYQLVFFGQGLPRLDSLNIENNNLAEIPAELASIPTLRTLLIAGNPQKGVLVVLCVSGPSIDVKGLCVIAGSSSCSFTRQFRSPEVLGCQGWGGSCVTRRPASCRSRKNATHRCTRRRARGARRTSAGTGTSTQCTRSPRVAAGACSIGIRLGGWWHEFSAAECHET